ncbi:hypothetical protein VNO77_08017 [Canavalia gladiata]|uniref:Uncharacterized protein n=1 Tax=Canavalia gladiata TaxID=3824 RepID=A0AAN9M910_CANGL
MQKLHSNYTVELCKQNPVDPLVILNYVEAPNPQASYMLSGSNSTTKCSLLKAAGVGRISVALVTPSNKEDRRSSLPCDRFIASLALVLSYTQDRSVIRPPSIHLAHVGTPWLLYVVMIISWLPHQVVVRSRIMPSQGPPPCTQSTRPEELKFLTCLIQVTFSLPTA